MNKVIIVFILSFFFFTQSVLSQNIIYCDSVFHATDTLYLDNFQDTVSFSYDYTGSNGGVSGGIYVNQLVTFDDKSVIDTISIDYGNVLGTYVYASQTYLLELNYITSTIPDNYSVDIYYSIYANGNYCISPYTLVFPQTVGIDDEINEIEIRTFPNPASQNFTIDLPGEFKQISVEVMDIKGKQIFSSSYKSKNKIDMNLQNVKGLVFVKVKYGENIKVLKHLLQ